jgi:hypothetical protein
MLLGQASRPARSGIGASWTSLAHRPQSPVNRGRIVESQGFRDRG